MKGKQFNKMKVNEIELQSNYFIFSIIFYLKKIMEKLSTSINSL